VRTLAASQMLAESAFDGADQIAHLSRIERMIWATAAAIVHIPAVTGVETPRTKWTIFAEPIACTTGEVVELDGFVFCDLIPA
jgi:hypothetical protein